MISSPVVSVSQVMSSPVVAVTADHSVATAWEAMRERQVHHLVVLDDYGLAAVLDDRTLSAQWPAGGPEAPHRRKVGDIVRHGVQCVGPDEPAAAAARVMTESRCDAVPVVTRTGVVVGLVTATDLVAAVARGLVEVAGRVETPAVRSCEHDVRG